MSSRQASNRQNLPAGSAHKRTLKVQPQYISLRRQEVNRTRRESDRAVIITIRTLPFCVAFDRSVSIDSLPHHAFCLSASSVRRLRLAGLFWSLVLRV